jgi:sugar lactone lactonase YvrE
MTALEGDDSVELFVSNVLNGTVAGNGAVVDRGTVLRIDLWVPDQGEPREQSRTVVAGGFPERTDPAALVIGPTGLGLDRAGTLYVADTLANRVAAVPFATVRSSSAGTGRTVLAGAPLNAPLGLAVAPDGDILTVNGGDGNLIDLDRDGKDVQIRTITPNGAGALFGIAVTTSPRSVYFVDDGDNTLNQLRR